MIHIKRAETVPSVIYIDGGKIEGTPIGQDKPDKVKGTIIEVTENFIEKVKDHGTVSSGTEEFKLSDGTYHVVTVGGNFTMDFSGWPDSGKISSFTIELVNAGAHDSPFPAGIKWDEEGVEPSWTASGLDYALILSRDGGTTLRGGRSWRDSK